MTTRKPKRDAANREAQATPAKPKGKHGGARPGGVGKRVIGVPWRQVGRVAETGAPLEDIVRGLGIKPDEAERHRERLELEVENGHARYRLRLASRAHREGVLKGRPTVLLASLRKHLGYDKSGLDLAPPEADVFRQLEAVMAAAETQQKAVEREAEAAKVQEAAEKAE